jgi:tetratricopeptide (TPR) repeat protein
MLGLMLVKQGRFEESAAAYREALAIFTAIDPHHFEVGKARNGLGLIASRQGRHAEAEREMAAAVAVLRQALGDQHPFVWQGTSNLAMEVAAQGRREEAEELLRGALERLRAAPGPDSDFAAGVEVRLGGLLRHRGELAEARRLHEHALAAYTELYGERHLETATARWHLARDLAALGESESAAAELGRAERTLTEVTGGSARLRELRAGDRPNARG